MKCFVERVDRKQSTLFPDQLKTGSVTTIRFGCRLGWWMFLSMCSISAASGLTGLANTLKRVTNIIGIGPPVAAMSAASALVGFHLRLDPANSPPGTANPGPLDPVNQTNL